MGTRTRIGTKGVVSTKTSDGTASDAFLDVTTTATVPWVWGAPQRNTSIAIVDGLASFNITASVTLSTPPVGGATGILPGISSSWVGQMFTISKMGTAALTISSSNVIIGTGSYTMTLTGSQFATIPGLLGSALIPFNSATTCTFLSVLSQSTYVWYVI